MKVNPRNPHDSPPDVVPPDVAPPDATIIIFGAAVRPDGRPSQTLKYRVQAAARFAARFKRPAFIPTGAKGLYGEAEAEVMAQLLIEAGFLPWSIQKETTGTDTLSSVRAVMRMLPKNTPIYACTSAYHLPRCLVLLRLAGVKARACPPPPVPAATSHWRRWYWRLRETPPQPYDALLMLWLRATGRV
jgi:uncharacterized SAM-binding protein YcdF (DUF218 family)